MTRLFQELIKKRKFTSSFLNPKYEDLPSAWLLPDMRKAVERIRKAVQNRERVIIYGDYDADGVTASTVMRDALKMAGVGEIETMLPDRFKDGYGMSEKVVEHAKESGASLVITVDCGSGNREIVEKLKKEGVETIVTDHHECPEELPKAVAVVNPKRRDLQNFAPDFEEHLEELTNLRDLAGVGVAFMVARALVEEKMIPAGQEKWMLDLVLIGTICDSMPMSAVNRILCYFGMLVIKKTRRPGLKELIRTAGVKEFTADTIGFQIGPRINAAGRMANAEIALGLLQSETKTQGAKLAMELEKLNEERRNQQVAAMREFKERGAPEDAVLVATGNWHEGVLGIIAGRLTEDYRRPAFVLTEVEEGVYKGSGRSFGDFSLAEALRKVEGVIIGGGGHAGAAGVKVAKEKLEEFRARINEYYDSLELRNQEKFFEQKADLKVMKFGGFSLDFMEELKTLEPFGAGNEMPIFEAPEAFVLDKKLMGVEEQHVRLIVRGDDGVTMKLVAFNVPEAWRAIENGQAVDVLFTVEESEWNGLKSVEGRIVDLRGC